MTLSDQKLKEFKELIKVNFDGLDGKAWGVSELELKLNAIADSWLQAAFKEVEVDSKVEALKELRGAFGNNLSTTITIDNMIAKLLTKPKEGGVK